MTEENQWQTDLSVHPVLLWVSGEFVYFGLRFDFKLNQDHSDLILTFVCSTKTHVCGSEKIMKIPDKEIIKRVNPTN